MNPIIRISRSTNVISAVVEMYEVYQPDFENYDVMYKCNYLNFGPINENMLVVKGGTCK